MDTLKSIVRLGSTARRGAVALASWPTLKAPKRCPANCNGPHPIQRLATAQEKTNRAMPVTARAWACNGCDCVYTLEPLGLPRIWFEG